MRYRRLLYRALNPVWARQPLSGAEEQGGAARYAGLVVPTYARGAPAELRNLVLWR